MAKEITIHLGCEARVLKFRSLSILKYASEYLNGEDPLTIINSTDPAAWYNRVRAFTIAGLRCAGDKSAITDIDEWIEDMSFEDAARVMNTCMEAILGGNGKAGEAQARELVNQNA